MNLGYIRVSTQKQHEDRQEYELSKQFNIEKWFIDKASGKNLNRPSFKEMINFAREGDVIYVYSFSRIARSTYDLLKLIALLDKKKIYLVSLKDNFDLSTPQGRFMVTVIGAMNQLERENMLEMQAEGIYQAKLRGVFKGRKAISKPKDWESVYHKWKIREITATTAMTMLGLKKNTFYRFVKEESLKLDSEE